MTVNSLETKIEVALDQISRVREDIAKLDEKLNNQYVTKYEYQSLRVEVDDLSSNQRWVVRTFMGSLISAIIGAVYVLAGLQ